MAGLEVSWINSFGELSSQKRDFLSGLFGNSDAKAGVFLLGHITNYIEKERIFY